MTSIVSTGSPPGRRAKPATLVVGAAESAPWTATPAEPASPFLVGAAESAPLDGHAGRAGMAFLVGAAESAP